MAVRQILLMVVIGIGTFVPASWAAVTLEPGVRVRIYDGAGIDAQAKAAALAVARATLAPAADVEWTGCDEAARCEAPPADGEFVLRFVRSAPAAASGRRGPAALHSSAGLPLGDAFIDLGKRAGVLATIYVDRVTLLATVARVAAPVLLGRAIAHEIGHLLLASNAHSRHGLMRPVWSSEELRRGRETDWRFTGDEIVAIRRRP